MRDRRKQEIDMVRVTVCLLFSTRRQEKITRIKRGPIDEAPRMVPITEMKNPDQKYGNDVWCLGPDEACAVMQSMPKVADEVHYNARSGSASFARGATYWD